MYCAGVVLHHASFLVLFLSFELRMELSACDIEKFQYRLEVALKRAGPRSETKKVWKLCGHVCGNTQRVFQSLELINTRIPPTPSPPIYLLLSVLYSLSYSHLLIGLNGDLDASNSERKQGHLLKQEELIRVLSPPLPPLPSLEVALQLKFASLLLHLTLMDMQVRMHLSRNRSAVQLEGVESCTRCWTCRSIS